MAKIRRYCRTIIVLYRQVTFDQIIGEFVDRPVRYRAPFVENTIAVRNTTRERQLLLNKQYRNAVIVIEPYDDFTDFMNDVRLYTLGRLVEDQDSWIEDQRPTDGKLLLLPT